MSVASGCQNNGLVGVALVLGDLAVVPGSFFGWRFVCLLIRCVYLRGCFGYCGKIRAPCILFSPITRKKGPPWRRLREMHAFRAEVGRIFVPCIRFGVQSGDFGCIARESCQGGPLFLRRGPWNHTWGEDLANAWRCAGLSAPAGRIRTCAV